MRASNKPVCLPFCEIGAVNASPAMTRLCTAPSTRRTIAMTDMIETGTYRSIPRKISQLTDFVTPEPDVFVLAHLGIPHLVRDDWSLSVTGMTAKPLVLRFDDLVNFQAYRITAFHKCAGNPMKPAEPTPDRVANVIWRGIRLRDVLSRAGYDFRATHVWADGIDGGSFEGVAVENIRRTFPSQSPAGRRAARLRDQRRAAERPSGRAGAARGAGLVRDQFRQMAAGAASRRRPRGRPFHHSLVQRYGCIRHWPPGLGGSPDSAIVMPAAGEKIDAGTLTVHGWSWGEHDIARVDLSTDGGASWMPATSSPRTDKSWQAFSAQLRIDRSGPVQIISRATDVRGEVQPMSGARNASVAVEVQIQR